MKHGYEKLFCMANEYHMLLNVKNYNNNLGV